MSLSPTLGKNEEVEQHIKKKTHKLNALRFWIEGGVILLYGFDSVLIVWDLPGFLPKILPTITFIEIIRFSLVVEWVSHFYPMEIHAYYLRY